VFVFGVQIVAPLEGASVASRYMLRCFFDMISMDDEGYGIVCFLLFFLPWCEC